MDGRRKRWAALLVLVAGIACLAYLWVLRIPTADLHAKNLVVVMIDTLRSDHLASYGYAQNTTPFLSKLAGESVQLQGYSASSWTRPSVATFLTGLHPQRHETISRSDRLPPKVPYLPTLLARGGLNTAAFTSNGNVGEEVGFSRGFDVFVEREPKVKLSADEVTKQALAIAKELKPPFLLYIHYIDPHDPYVPEKPWGRFDVTKADYVQPKDFLQKKYPMQSDEMGRMRAQYDGEIHEMDGALERLVEGLRADGLLESTLLVVTADHGEEFGEHGGVAHGHHLHEEVVRVPFLLHMDGLRPYRSDAPFHHVDFVPTMLEALGLPPSSEVDGTSRWSEIVAERPDTDQELLFHLDLDRFGEIAVLQTPYKLIHRPDRDTLLYDLSSDANEKAPIGDAEYRRNSLTRAVIERHNELSAESTGRVTTSLSSGLRQRLAALGYMQPEEADPKLAERVLPKQLAPDAGEKTGSGG